MRWLLVLLLTGCAIVVPQHNKSCTTGCTNSSADNISTSKDVTK